MRGCPEFKTKKEKITTLPTDKKKKGLYYNYHSKNKESSENGNLLSWGFEPRENDKKKVLSSTAVRARAFFPPLSLSISLRLADRMSMSPGVGKVCASCSLSVKFYVTKFEPVRMPHLGIIRSHLKCFW